MTEKDQLIRAFKSLDFEALGNLLDDNRSYMKVSKTLFLSRLKEKLDQYEHLNSYENVIEGTCDCNKGCKGYKFKTEGFPSLSLVFEEKNEKVTDIYLCYTLNLEIPDEKDWGINFRFYEDEKVNFKPTIQHLIILQRIEKAIDDINKLESKGIVPFQEVEHWFNNMKDLADELNLNVFLAIKKYKAFIQIDSIYSKVSNLVHSLANNQVAQDGLREYHQLNKEDEKMIVRWLLKHKDNYFYPLKKTDNWKKTGIIILESEPNLIVDCSDFLDSFLFDEIYNNHKVEIMNKYKPTAAHYDQNEGRVEFSLENYLKLYNKYVDLL